MKIITTQERSGYLPPQVQGVELDGFTDAVTLADNLGAYAQDAMEHPPLYSFPTAHSSLLEEQGLGLGLFESRNKTPLAAEALTLQSQLLKYIGSGVVGEGAFSFKAVDQHAGQALKAAVELAEEVASSATTRPATRFPEQSLLARLSIIGLLGDIQDRRIPEDRIQSQDNYQFGDKYQLPEIKPMASAYSSDKYEKYPDSRLPSSRPIHIPLN